MRYEDERRILLDIAAEHDGLLTVDTVVEAARDEGSPLHSHFEWDDSDAAREYRRWQARVLIAKCRITVESRPDTVIRAFVSLPSDRANGGGYRVTVNVLEDKDRRAELVKDMEARVKYWMDQAALMDAPLRRAVTRLHTALKRQGVDGLGVEAQG